MRQVKKYLALAALIACGMSVSCVKEKSPSREEGSQIVFNASTGYESGPFVRTEYSGAMVDVGTRRYERIDWVLGSDQIRILCEAAEDGPAADYAISGAITNTGEISSSATITPLVRYGLHWGTGDHYFYALYPAPGMKSNYAFTDRTVSEANAKIEAVTGNKAKITGVIPATQELFKVESTGVHEYKANLNYGYLYAKKKTTPSGSGSVQLDFNPLFTAFEFTLLGQTGNIINSKMTSVKLSTTSSKMTGKFEAELAMTASPVITSVGTTGKEVTATLPDGGILLDDTTPVKFTLLALPFDQTNLTLSLFFANGQKRTLELKDSGQWLTVGACKKVYIRNLGVPDIYTYVLEHTGPVVTLSDGSSAQVLYRNNEGAGSTNVGPFETYKTTDGGTTKIPVDVEVLAYAPADAHGNPVMSGGKIAWQSTRPEGLTSAVPSGTQVDREMTATVSKYVGSETTVTESELINHARKLKSNGTASNKDLSLYDIEKLSTPRASGKPVTANCYVVDRAGTYRFPVVYGNSIDWTKSGKPGYVNGVNVYSYYDGTPSGSDSNQYDVIHHLQNCNASWIKTPYILDDMSITDLTKVEAVVVWEDVKDASQSFITVDPALVNVTGTNRFWDPVNNTWKANVPYIQFTIPMGAIDEDETKEPAERVTGIRQGNAVIALRRKSDNVILWSWHIWVTDGYDTDGDWMGDSMTPIRVPTRNSTVTSYNMMLPMNVGWCNNSTISRYPDRVWYVRIRQTEGDAEPIIFKVVQGHTAVMEEYRAGEPYYQWGRKDPFIPSDGHSRSTSSHSGVGKNKDAYSPTGYTLFRNDMGVTVYRFTNQLSGGCVSYSIQNPHYYYCSENTIDNGTYEFNWMKATYPFNLWNMANGNAIGEDIKVSKTVYDPCPPGYSVPHYKAFTWFTSTGEDGHAEIELIEDMDGDGVITENDIEVGFYFKTGQGGNTIFFPQSGVRCGMHYFEEGWLGEVHSVRGDGLAWTAASRNRQRAYNLYIDYSLRVEPFHNNGRDMAVPVRPCKEL